MIELIPPSHPPEPKNVTKKMKMFHLSSNNPLRYHDNLKRTSMFQL